MHSLMVMLYLQQSRNSRQLQKNRNRSLRQNRRNPKHMRSILILLRTPTRPRLRRARAVNRHSQCQRIMAMLLILRRMITVSMMWCRIIMMAQIQHRMIMAILQIQKQVIMGTKISLLEEKQLIQMTIQQMEQRMQKDQRQRVTMRVTFWIVYVLNLFQQVIQQ